MTHIFLSEDGRLRDSWCKAFPGVLAGRIGQPVSGESAVWVLLPPGRHVDSLVEGLRKTLAGRPLIVLADEPAEDDAMLALSAGASGYCNSHAAPQVLQQIATVVDNGGLWIGQALMQRLVTATSRLLPAPSTGDSAAWRSALTAREQEVALLLAQGASNKEIARQLDITERTVKSHVSAMLEKLGARDRLQLSLVINGTGNKR